MESWRHRRGGGGGAQPIAVLDNSETTLHIVTVLEQCCTYVGALILLCKRPNHTRILRGGNNIYNYTQKF